MRGSKGGSPRGHRQQEEQPAAGEMESQSYDEESELPDLIMDIEDDVLQGQEYEESEVSAETSQDKSRAFFKGLALLGLVLCLVLLALLVYFGATYAGASGKLRTARDSLQNTTEGYLKLQQQVQLREEQFCTQFRNSTEHWLHLFCEKYECPSRICDPGWLLFGRSCFRFLNISRSWDQSREACAELQGHLAIIGSEKVQTFLSEQVKDLSHWIGLTDKVTEGSWVWVDGTKVVDGTTFWANGEPDNAYNRTLRETENCGLLSQRGWADQVCARHFPAICEKSAIRLHLIFQRARRG
ncbi:C-type lectin domain family 7 member A-like [Pristis pectinata]|uniref:C-type lectin domain family 7 member A-like n=1 Tax=Pristis pectinata TaxID=685728 RepID=UPI00223D3BDD|nr:C-type lectin domain family 7 member A-like [Pristis pectinata]